MLPKSCKMPDLSHLDPLTPGFIAAVMGFRGELLTSKEKAYMRVLVRLTERAIIEYNVARKCIIDQIKEMKSAPEEMEKKGRHLYMLNFIDHMEYCINTIRRLFWILEAAKREPNRGLTIDHFLRNRIETHYDNVKKIRDFIIHIDERIHDKETTGVVMLKLSDDDTGVEIMEYSLEFNDLTILLERFHELACQWLDDFCKKQKKKDN